MADATVCDDCGHENAEPYVTCERCGEWLNEEVLYA